MGFSDTAMQDAADAIRAKYTFVQIHTAAAGAAGTNNVSSAGREAFTWGAATNDGDFDIAADVDMTGGESAGPVYSFTIWDADTNGTFGGEFLRTIGDAAFNVAGEYTITAITNDGNAT